MTPIAAYYVMIATDVARDAQTPRYDSNVRKPSRFARIGHTLGLLVALGRPVTTQPA